MTATRRSLLAALAAMPAQSWAQQQAAQRRIGVLAPSTAARESVTLKPFLDQMLELGWVEGSTVTYGHAYADDQTQELPRLQPDHHAMAPALAARGMPLTVGRASSAADFDAAVAMLLRDRVEAIMTDSSLSFNRRDRPVELLRGQGVAIVGQRREMVVSGALFSYGASLPAQFRRSAIVVDKILRGAQPGEIPVEQPTTFELVMNLGTAAALGITIPPAILLRADEVIR